MTPPGRPALADCVEAVCRRLRSAGGVAAGDVRVVVSPYRICPLGAHSDHQHGPVLGSAIDIHSVLAFAAREEPWLELSSADFPGEVRVDLRSPEASPAAGWGVYARAAAAALREHLPRHPLGLRGHIAGGLPGAGLSSSASVLIAYLLALGHANGLSLAAETWVRLSRRAENRYVGVASGALDPACIVGSRRGCLLVIDTAAPAWEPVAPPPGAPAARFLVAFSGASRHLTATAFNRRVEECLAAARRLGELAGTPRARLLGELPEDAFEAHGAALPEALRRRARHFFTERARVRRGVLAWRRGDLEDFGALMSASCESSIRDYETGSPELVRLQELLLGTPGVLGARFSGAGFGGCGIALVDDADATRERVERELTRTLPGGAARVFAVEGEDGARVLPLSQTPA